MASEAGLEHVRLPVRFNTHAEEPAPYSVRAKLWKRLDWALAQARENKLKLVLDFHHYTELMEAPDQHADRCVRKLPTDGGQKGTWVPHLRKALPY